MEYKDMPGIEKSLEELIKTEVSLYSYYISDDCANSIVKSIMVKLDRIFEDAMAYTDLSNS